MATATAAALAFGPAASAEGPRGDPLDDANLDVSQAQRAADQIAEAFFIQLGRLKALEGDIAATEEHMAELEAEVEELTALVADRAAIAYRRAGSASLIPEFHSDEPMRGARRGTLLDELNEQDNDAAAELNDITELLETKRQELEAARAEQEQAVAELEEKEAEVNAALTEAQARRGFIAAQQQLESEAAAAAAAATTTTERGAAPAPAAVAPPPPPPNYNPTPGEHPKHYDPFLVCTRGVESGGNYSAVNPEGPYHGAYQFLQSTWNSTANHAGRSELIGVVPSKASEYDQDDMAWVLYEWQGNTPWGNRC